VGLVFAVAHAAHASSVTCTNAGDLQTALNSAVNILTVSGTCTSASSPFLVTTPNLVIDGGGSGIVKDQFLIAAAGVTIKNFIINGSSPASGAGVAIVILPGASAIVSNTNINTWTGDGIDVYGGGSLAIAGGAGAIIDASGGSGIYFRPGSSGSVGYVPTNTGLNAEINITSNAVGVTVDADAAVVFLLPELQQNHNAGLVVVRNAAVELIGGLVENNQADGIDVSDGATLVFNSSDLGASGTATVISSNHGVGIALTDATLDMDKANITDNLGDGIDASVGSSVTINGGTISANDGGGINVSHSVVKLRGGLTVSGNSGGPPITALYSSIDEKSGTYTAPGTLGKPTLYAYRSNLVLNGTTLSGPNNSNTLGAYGGSSVLLYNTSISSADSTDATLVAADGTTVTSAGKNIIHNTSNGSVMLVTNAGNFHEETYPALQSSFAFTPGADTITGTGSVQVESNIELGTGAATPSGWTGTITVAQNSAMRMDGGITVTGAVKLTQASNGFFNVSNSGENIVTLGVTCPFTTNASAHVAGNANVLLMSGGASAVTIGNTSPDCLGF